MHDRYWKSVVYAITLKYEMIILLFALNQIYKSDRKIECKYQHEFK